MMKLQQYLIEGKHLKDPMIGFGVDDSLIRPTVKHIKSWLIRYDIPYEAITDYHLTIAQILGNYEKDMLVRLTNSIDIEFTLNPLCIKILKGKLTPKDYIVIEYHPATEFVKSAIEISKELEVVKFNRVIPHISLFSIPRDALSDQMFNDMMHVIAPLKKVTPTEVQLWNSLHLKEYHT